MRKGKSLEMKIPMTSSEYYCIQRTGSLVQGWSGGHSKVALGVPRESMRKEDFALKRCKGRWGLAREVGRVARNRAERMQINDICEGVF